MHQFIKIIFGIKLYMFRTVPLSFIICWQFAVSKTVWRIPLLCLQWKTPDDGQRNRPKHVEFYSKNKFEKLARLVGFIIRILLRYFYLLICLFFVYLFIYLFFRLLNHSLTIAGFFQVVLQIVCCAVCYTDRVKASQINRCVSCLF